MFKFELGQKVKIAISEESGHVKARGEYLDAPNCYLIHYKAADGRADDRWFNEDDLANVTE